MMMWRTFLAGILLVVLGGPGAPSRAADEPRVELPWDYSPYRVMIWIAGDAEPTVREDWRNSILAYLDRDFAALWRTEIAAAPASIAALARRDFASIDYQALSADDPVLAIKRNHPAASRIRYPADVATTLKSIRVVPSYADSVRERGAAVDNANLHGSAALFQPFDGDLLAMQQVWAQESTEGVLVPYGIARALEPVAKLVPLNVAGRMDDLFDNYDKVFIVLVDGAGISRRISVREIDAPMRLAGPIVEMTTGDASDVPVAIARCVSQAFAPVVRLEDAGTDIASGRVRAGGLILDSESPAAIKVGDFLQPMLRKDGAGGEPMLIEVIDWTYLKVTEQEGAKLAMELFYGRAGTLQGRRNNRTHRMAMKVRPVLPQTILRLHAKGQPDEPLVGYDVYEKDLESGDMEFIGSTDWDGQMVVSKTDAPMRLMYVKNGTAILARLPLVPGQNAVETADLVADDMRLRAEAYIRGVQNAVIDLVAIRKLFAAAVRLHIKQGDLQKAEEMLDKLRKEPSFKTLADDMEQKATEIRSRNATIQKRIDNMFRDTRELMVQHLSPTLLRDLEGEFFAAGGGQAPPVAPVTEEAPVEEAPATEEAPAEVAAP